jgi:hypothetical protein
MSRRAIRFAGHQLFVSADMDALGLLGSMTLLASTPPAEGWPSGLRRTLGKRVCVKAYRGFESHSLRQTVTEAAVAPGVGSACDHLIRQDAPELSALQVTAVVAYLHLTPVGSRLARTQATDDARLQDRDR